VPNIAVEQLERPDGQRTHAGPLLLTRRTGKATETEYYNALWPSRFPVQWLLKQRTILGDRDFEALYQQSPYVLGGNLFKEHWFKRYKMSDLPDQFHALAISVDTAFKAKTVNDYSVFTVGGITELGDIYLLKVFRLKVEFPELKKQAVRINALYRGQGLRGMWVEDAASGQVLIQELRKDTGVPVLPWKPGAADKTSRANSITPLIEGGRVYIPEEADWLDDWLTEMQTFPSGKNDDQVDGFVILMDVLSRMVVNGMQEFNAPIGQLASGKLGSDLLFSNAPLRSDPNGWRGQGSFGTALGQMPWKNWGE
jgi:predicted phage terminase large subunit-like protein